MPFIYYEDQHWNDYRTTSSSSSGIFFITMNNNAGSICYNMNMTTGTNNNAGLGDSPYISNTGYSNEIYTSNTINVTTTPKHDIKEYRYYRNNFNYIWYCIPFFGYNDNENEGYSTSGKWVKQWWWYFGVVCYNYKMRPSAPSSGTRQISIEINPWDDSVPYTHGDKDRESIIWNYNKEYEYNYYRNLYIYYMVLFTIRVY